MHTHAHLWRCAELHDSEESGWVIHDILRKACVDKRFYVMLNELDVSYENLLRGIKKAMGELD